MPTFLDGGAASAGEGFLASELTGSEERPPLFTVLPVPYEASVSYGGGTSGGPAAILAASQQLERWDGHGEPISAGIATLPPLDCRGEAAEVLARIEAVVGEVVLSGSMPVLLGGEHSLSLGAIRALAAGRSEPLGIIQLDAHADLRDSLGGNRYSHACVMRRALEESDCHLFQFGVRALCREEADYRRSRADRVAHLDGPALYRRDLSDFRLPAHFPGDLYLTLDVDGLDPAVIAATGTPVPGGPGWYDTLLFLERALAGRRLLGFDLVELAPRPGEHGADFAAAQLVYQVMGLVVRNR